jgi:hypothetical protein
MFKRPARQLTSALGASLRSEKMATNGAADRSADEPKRTLTDDSIGAGLSASGGDAGKPSAVPAHRLVQRRWRTR